MIFKDRTEAGRQLIAKLNHYKGDARVIILALPRGGVVVADKIAQELDLPLDILVPRKIGAPGSPEFAIGAIAEDVPGVFDWDYIKGAGISEEYLKQEIEKEKAEANRRLLLYRSGRPPLNLKDRTALIVDDGAATGATMLAAIQSAKAKGATRIIVAVPVLAQEALQKISNEVDEVIYLNAPNFFFVIGEFYESFPQVEDAEVIKILG